MSSSDGPRDPLFNAALFSEDHWNRPVPHAERQRLDLTSRALPDDVRTVIDVGGGDGRLARALEHRPALNYAIVDYSPAALKRVTLPCARGTAAAIPIATSAVDCVVCCEVLEHLPDGVLEAAISELQRASRRYVLVTVPFEEQLERNSTACPVCHRVFHVEGHLQQFSIDRLRSMFTASAPLVLERILGCRARPFSPALLAVKQRSFSLWAYGPDLVCPACGNREFPPPGGRLARAGFGALNAILRPRRSAGGWILGLFIVEKS